MYLSKAFLALALACSVPLTGCTTTATSSHSTDPVATGTPTNLLEPSTADDLSDPVSDSTGTKGDPSAQMLQKGKENFAAQNYGLSEKYFRQAVELRTDSASGWAGLAASYDQLGNFAFADRAYQQLVKLRGNDPRVLNNLGYSYLLRGDYQKARSYFNRAQKANPGLEHLQGNIELLEQIANS